MKLSHYHPSKYCCLPSFIPFRVPLLSTCLDLSPPWNLAWDFWCTSSLSALIYIVRCTMGQSPYLMKIRYYFYNSHTLHTHTHIYSYLLLFLEMKREMWTFWHFPGRVACMVLGFVLFCGLFFPNYKGLFFFFGPGWSLASTLSGPGSFSCLNFWNFFSIFGSNLPSSIPAVSLR